jgi:hypothetical protein
MTVIFLISHSWNSGDDPRLSSANWNFMPSNEEWARGSYSY